MLKILLADDSNVAQRMGKEILSAEGYEVLTVSNGQAALKKLSEFLPDLLIADVFMPGTGGYDLCQFVKSDKNQRHVPVILLVGAMEPYDPDEGRRVKADGVVTKPLQSSNLVKIVKNLLASVSPAPVAPKKEKLAKAAAPVVEAVEEVEPLTPPVAAVEQPAEELVSRKIEVPKEMADQPLSAFEDLLGPAAPETKAEPEVGASGASPEAAELLPMEHSLDAIAPEPPMAFPMENFAASEPAPEAKPNQPAMPFEASALAAEAEPDREKIEFPVAPSEAGDEPASSSIFPTFPGEAQEHKAETGPQMAMPVEEDVASATVESTEIPLLEIPAVVESSEEVSAAVPAPPELRWIAEPAEVTEEEKKLFDEPKANWQELEQMTEAEEVSASKAEPAPSAGEAELAETVSYVPGDSLPEVFGAVPQQSLDAAEIKHLVRDAVAEMMPQIVERVSQALKNQLRH